ncbi:Hypothetical predicted protein [Olea europaea subsp. europaea]|uniref:Uncharacterized protein n=1 Tax=Olea europaea subsp. europaea TaxID=158383 RepID=A0A8S0S7R0_OLEEU|nr:Hypothetical predicted protein [Olea europaea subsp. europaea]
MSKYDRNIHGNSLDLSHNSHTRMLSSGHGTNANEGYSLQDNFGCHFSGGEIARAARGSTRKMRLDPSPRAAYKTHEHKYGPACMWPRMAHLA